MLAGVSHYQDAVARLSKREHLTVEPEPENRHDLRALRVCATGATVGYLPRGFVTALGPHATVTKAVVKSTGRPRRNPGQDAVPPLGVRVLAWVVHAKVTEAQEAAWHAAGEFAPS